MSWSTGRSHLRILDGTRPEGHHKVQSYQRFRIFLFWANLTLSDYWAFGGDDEFLMVFISLSSTWNYGCYYRPLEDSYFVWYVWLKLGYVFLILRWFFFCILWFLRTQRNKVFQKHGLTLYASIHTYEKYLTTGMTQSLTDTRQLSQCPTGWPSALFTNDTQFVQKEWSLFTKYKRIK